MLRFLFVALTIVLVNADTCNFNDFMICIKDKADIGAKGQKRQEWKSQAEDCIKKQGCAINMNAGNQAWKDVKECKMKIKMSIKSDIESCVQSKYPGFKFPDTPKDDENENHWTRKDVTCPNNKTASVLKECHSTIFNKSSGDDWRARVKEQRQKYCAARSECQKKLPASCRIEDLQSTMCQCFKDKIQPKLDQIKSQIDACEAKMPNNDEDMKVKRGKGRGDRTEAEVMFAQFCKKQDLCDKANMKLVTRRTFDMFLFF